MEHPERSYAAYNVFHLKQEPDLCCAVRQDRHVPSFIIAERWNYRLTWEDKDDAPLGFQRKAAKEATNTMGFYIFLAV